jgi:hypothetical protein
MVVADSLNELNDDLSGDESDKYESSTSEEELCSKPKASEGTQRESNRNFTRDRSIDGEGTQPESN